MLDVGRPLPILCLSILLQACSQDGSDATTSAGVPRFTDVTDRAGLRGFVQRTGASGGKWFPETMGAGGGFLDYNGDDWADILLVAGGSWSEEEHVPSVRLYRNNRDGTFTDVTEDAGLAAIPGYGFGMAAADYDNDGDDDFFLTTLQENLLFENKGGHFVERGRQADVEGPAVWSTAAVFFDADRDGWLDLFVANYVVWSPEQDIFCTVDGRSKAYCQPTLYEGLPGTFYHNDGDGTFSDVSEEAGFNEVPGKTLGVASFDYNRDGWPDLVVANDTQRDLLFENDGDGTFTEKGVLGGIAFDVHGNARGGMGIDTGVIDTTGRESIFVGNFSNEMVGVYRYRGNGLFQDRTAFSQVGRPSLRKVTFGLFLFDADLDGDLDLLAANGNIRDEHGAQDGVPYRQETQLFVNQGNGRFAPVEPSMNDPLARPMVARGAAFADYDRDGDLDVLLTENGGPAHLWRNELKDRNALRVHVRGRESNRDGVGAQIEIHVGGVRMHRRIRTGSSYLSQSEKVATFGLGTAEEVDSLIVRWPSGRADRFANLEVPQEIRLIEGEAAYERLPRSPHQSVGYASP